MDVLVSVDWLKAHWNDSDLMVLDASAPNIKSGKSPELDALKITGAQLFDLKNNFSNQESNLPNTFPSTEQFQEECQKLGVNQNTKIVVYDNLGIYWSPRVWFMFKAMGHKNIAVLDGGLPEWMKKGFYVENRMAVKSNTKGNFKASYNSEMVVDFTTVLENSKEEKALLIDARSKGRFEGTEPEPRKDLRSGNIPNSINIPFTRVLENGKFKSESELSDVFKDLEKETKPLIFSCGSGITACIVLLASTLVFDTKQSVYDGSWTEWAQKVK